MIQLTFASIVPGGLGLLLFAAIGMRFWSKPRPNRLSKLDESIQMSGVNVRMGPPYVYLENAKNARALSQSGWSEISIS